MTSSHWKITSPGTSYYLRFLGLGLLVFLLWGLDLGLAGQLLLESRSSLIFLALLLNFPLVFLRAFRWRQLLIPAQVRYPISRAMLSYMSSIFAGFLTPGRLGEIVKALHVSKDCSITIGCALPSILADRLFDMYGLFIVAGVALFSLEKSDQISIVGIVTIGLVFTVPLMIFLHERTFGSIRQIGLSRGLLGQRLFAPRSWLMEIRSGLKELTSSCLGFATFLTVSAYGVFFGQCYLLAVALGLDASFLQVSYAAALGSLVTLLPVSILGLGTREATIVAYLGTVGIPAEAALAFSFLVFFTFYITGGLMGAVAWWIKPVSLEALRQEMKALA